MTMNPNASVNDLHPGRNPLEKEHASQVTAGSLFAAAFILVISFIARHFYH